MRTRDAESLRKSAVLTGKEEMIRLREEWELEVRKRREEIEGEETRPGTGKPARSQVRSLEQREKDAPPCMPMWGRRQGSDRRSREKELEGSSPTSDAGSSRWPACPPNEAKAS